MTNEARIGWMINNRNRLFVDMCFVVHTFLLIIFSIIGIEGMVVLNILSLLFYISVKVKKDYSVGMIVIAYFEIISFASLSTLMLGRQVGFLLYIIGMLAVIFYLAYDRGDRRFYYQGSGCALIILMAALDPFCRNYFLPYKEKVAPYVDGLYVMNIVITIGTVVMVSFLYAQEINRMNRELKDVNDKLIYDATHDHLTGLINRYRMEEHIDNINRDKNESFMVAMMDVDDFKEINDRYGHKVGDMALKMISKEAAECLKNFHVARWGGEEFILISRNVDWNTGMGQIRRFHERIQQQDVEYEEGQLRIHMTIGAVQGDNSHPVSHWMMEADELLYIGKNGHKNCIVTMENKEDMSSK